MSNLFFSHGVFKRLALQTRKNQGLFGKGFKNAMNVTDYLILSKTTDLIDPKPSSFQVKPYFRFSKSLNTGPLDSRSNAPPVFTCIVNCPCETIEFSGKVTLTCLSTLDTS